MKKLFGIVMLLLISITGVSGQGLDMQATIPTDPDVRIGTLENGLTYYIRHNAKPEKQAEFYILHNVGAMQEEDPQIGLAHFLEHMAFNGTKNFPDKNLINYLATIGVRFGANLNAGTSTEYTVYNISSVPLLREGIIDSALLILHDWSYFITLDPKEIDDERGVIIEEFRTGNNAQRRIMEKNAPTLYNKSKYAERNVIGNEQALRSFSHKELVDFYHRWYRTDQQAIIVVGDFDVDKMEAKIKATMADIPKVENPQAKAVIPIPDNVEPLVNVTTDPELTNTTASIYVKRAALPTMLNDKVVVEKINIALYIFGQMANNRLAEIAQKPNAPFVNAGVGQGAITTTCDVIMAEAVAREGEALKAFEGIYTEMEKIRRFGFTQPEFDRAQSDAMRAIQSQYDNRKDRRNGQFVQTYISNFRKNSPMPTAEDEFQLDSMIIATTNLMEINAISQGMITNENQVVIINGPQKKGVAMPSESDVMATIIKVRNSEIEAYADNTVKEPLISTELKSGKVVKTTTDLFGATVWTLDNGAKVVIKPTDFKADEVLFSAEAQGGLSLISDAEYPSGEMLPALVSMSGVSKFSASELAKQLAGKAVSVNPSVSSFASSIEGTASPKDLETLLQLTNLYITSPRFDKADYDVMIDRYKAALANMSSNPNFVMQENAMKTLYGDNPRRQALNNQRLEQVSYETMVDLYQKFFAQAGDFTFKFVGNVNLETLKPLVEKYIGSLPKAKGVSNWKDDKVTLTQDKTTNRFDVAMQTPKTSILTVMHGSIKNNTENRLTMNTLKMIMDLRYTATLREEKGGTYGVSTATSLSSIPNDRYIFQAQFDTDPAMADELMEIIVTELEKIANNGPLAEDLAKSKEYFTKQRPDDLKKNSTWLNYISNYYVTGNDFNSDYDKCLAELNGDKVKALAAQILKDGNLIRVIMDPKK